MTTTTARPSAANIATILWFLAGNEPTGVAHVLNRGGRFVVLYALLGLVLAVLFMRLCTIIYFVFACWAMRRKKAAMEMPAVNATMSKRET